MDLIDALITRIISDGYATTKDVDIFKDTSPASPEECVAVFEYNGTPPAAFTDMSVRSIQITARAKTAARAKERIWNIYRALYTEDFMIVLGEKHCLMAMRNTPIKIYVDEQHRSVYGFNCGITTNIN